MSSALAIAGVTAVLRDRLNDGLVNHDATSALGSTVKVSALPPDRVVAVNTSEQSQLNLFLYQITPNPSYRNQALPAYDGQGQHRLQNPPLALDLSYLVSAYTGADLHAEILLGYAMQLFHEFPVLTREMIRTALNPSPDVGAALPPALRALADSGLADQLELLRITPLPLNTEEISKLWSATQSSLRPSAAYRVSVVLIEAQRPTRAPLPVLTRGERHPVTNRERGVVVGPSLLPPLPALEAVVPAGELPVARLGGVIALHGHHLDGTSRQVRLVNERFEVDELLPASGPNVGDRMELVIPAARAADFPVGVYGVSARVIPPGETRARETNRLACIVAPHITNVPQSVARDGGGNAAITLTFTPALRLGQPASLLLGAREIAPESFVAPTGSLDFVVQDVELGDPLARLRIDGIESPVVDRGQKPPVFFNHRVTIT